MSKKVNEVDIDRLDIADDEYAYYMEDDEYVYADETGYIGAIDLDIIDDCFDWDFWQIKEDL